MHTSKAFTKKLASLLVITIVLKTIPSKLKSSNDGWHLYVWEGFMGRKNRKMHIIMCKGRRVPVPKWHSLVFKQIPWDTANVNAWKNMGDPYIIKLVNCSLTDGLCTYYQCKQGRIMLRYKIWWLLIWATTWQNQQNDCAPSEDSDQPGHPPSLIRVFVVRMKKARVLSYPFSTQQRLWSNVTSCAFTMTSVTYRYDPSVFIQLLV